MADAESAPRKRAKGEDPLNAILEGPLRDSTAGERRAAVMVADARPLDDITHGFAELDALVEQLYRRLDALLVIESAPPMPVELPVEVGDAEVIEIEENAGVTAAAGDTPTLVVPDIQPPSLPPPVAVRRKRNNFSPEQRLAHQANLLYEDVIWLLAINDGQGALISLERLIVMADASGDVAEFLEVNNKKLLSLYEGFIGPFTKTPTPQTLPDGMDMPDGYKRNEKIAKMMALVNGKRTIADLIKASPYTSLQTCCILNQLRRSALVKI